MGWDGMQGEKEYSEWLRMDENGWEWMRMDGNGWEWMKMVGNGWEWMRIVGNVQIVFPTSVLYYEGTHESSSTIY